MVTKIEKKNDNNNFTNDSTHNKELVLPLQNEFFTLDYFTQSYF